MKRERQMRQRGHRTRHHVVPMTNFNQPPINTAVDLVPLPALTFNPYLLLSTTVIGNIARERDIMVSGTRENKAAMLHELDNILPEWRDDIRNKNIMTFRQFTGTKLQYYAAVNGLDMTKIPLTNTIDLLDFIEIGILVRDYVGHNRLISIVLNTRRHILEAFIVYMGLEVELAVLAPLKMLQIAITNNDIRFIDRTELKQYLTRYKFLVNHKHSAQLAKLYKTDKWEQVAPLSIHPMEKIITELDMLADDMLLNMFGIVVPISYMGRIHEYIVQNIAYYDAVLTRTSPKIITPGSLLFMGYDGVQQYFNQLTDKEIFCNFGAYVPYNNRIELITNLTNALFNTTFFVPCPPSIQLSINKETPISMMTFDETDQFFIAYGNISRYYTYEISELVGAFHRSEGGVIDFRQPQDITSTFTVPEVQELAKLLRCFAPTKYISELLIAIQTGIEELEERVATDSLFVKEFKMFSETDKQDIRRFLHAIFHIGMYMRRWKGPGHPYPIAQDATLIKEDPNDIVTECFKQTKYFLDGVNKSVLSFCMGLKICEYKDGRIECGQKEFHKEWTDVLNAKRCIRQASTMYIGTAYHYLVILFNERIPNINVKQVAAIL